MANPIATVFDLSGAWQTGGVLGPFIAVTGNAISVDMSAYGRPFAAGSVLDSSHISVTFGDDSTYTAELRPAGEVGIDTIQWSNNSTWTRPVLPASTLVDLNGKWVTAGSSEPAFTFSVTGKFIALDMSAAGRPLARGYVLDFADIFVDFPDAKGYTGKLQISSVTVSGGVSTVYKILWSNNSVWQQLYLPGPSISMVWQLQGSVKTIFVSGTGFAPGLVTIKLVSNNFQIAQFTASAAANGTFTASQGISCTGNATIDVSVFQSNSAIAVATSATLCPQIPQ
jgi:hypothetical protein